MFKVYFNSTLIVIILKSAKVTFLETRLTIFNTPDWTLEIVQKNNFKNLY